SASNRPQPGRDWSAPCIEAMQGGFIMTNRFAATAWAVALGFAVVAPIPAATAADVKEKAVETKDTITDKAVETKDTLKEKAVDAKETIKEKTHAMTDKVKS